MRPISHGRKRASRGGFTIWLTPKEFREAQGRTPVYQRRMENTNAKEAVRIANEARETYLKARLPLKEARAERARVDKLYTAAHERWKIDTSLEASNALREAEAALDAAWQRVSGLHSDRDAYALRDVWHEKIKTATSLLMKEAGLYDAQSCDEE